MPFTPEGTTVMVTYPEEFQLTRVLRAVRVELPFKVSLGTPDGVHLEVAMHVLDRDYHLRVGDQQGPRDKPYLRQVFSFDMSDEALALRQEQIIAGENLRPTDAEMDRLMRSEITDDEMAKLILGCVIQAVTHEVREGTYFRAVRIDDPHGPAYVKGRVL